MAALGLLATTAACGSTSPASASSNKPVPLVVYSAQGYDQAEVTAFQKATGIPTELTDSSTGPLLEKVSAEAQNPHWGLLWIDGDEPFAALDQQGALVKNFQPKVDYNQLGQDTDPSDHSYYPTGITLAGAVVYEPSQTPNPPTSWQELTQPQWKGQVAMNNPSISGPTFPFVAGMYNYLGGVSQGEAYFQALKANGLQVFTTNKHTLAALEQGQVKLAIIQSSAGIGAALKDPNIKVDYLSPETLLPSVIGIDAKVSKTEIAEAEKFVNFVLSPAGQQIMQSGDPTGDSNYYPVVNGVQPKNGVPALAGISTQTVDPYKYGPMESSINSWFTANIVS
jgi:iron(III) transport system substrate-binding protein